MKLQEFEDLALVAKCDVLYERGVYIGKTRTGEITRMLYNLEGYYVEIIYKKYRLFIQSITVLDNVEDLDPYLEQIDVEHFVSF